MLLGFSGSRAGVLLNILQSTGQSPQQRTVGPRRQSSKSAEWETAVTVNWAPSPQVSLCTQFT